MYVNHANPLIVHKNEKTTCIWIRCYRYTYLRSYLLSCQNQKKNRISIQTTSSIVKNLPWALLPQQEDEDQQPSLNTQSLKLVHISTVERRASVQVGLLANYVLLYCLFIYWLCLCCWWRICEEVHYKWAITISAKAKGKWVRWKKLKYLTVTPEIDNAELNVFEVRSHKCHFSNISESSGRVYILLQWAF